MIAEASIIRMLLNSHNLDTVVTVGCNTWQYVFAEFVISTNLFGILCHTYVAFVNHQRTYVGVEYFLLEFIRFCRIPYLCAEYLGLIILHYTSSPCRNSLTFATIPAYQHLVKVTMMQRIFRKTNFPVIGTSQTFQFIACCRFPVRKITDKINFLSIRCPFTEYPFRTFEMQSVIKVSTSKFW